MNDPVPLVVHVAEVAPPPKDPAMVAVAFEQIVWATPALTVAAAFTLIVLVALIAEQGDVALVVKVKVTVPVKFAAGVYVMVDGVAVWATLLNVPPPEVIDHAPVVAPPPTLAPLNVMADGVAD